MGSQMSTDRTLASTAAPIAERTRFVVVNDRFPGADAYCALCCEKIERDYNHTA